MLIMFTKLTNSITTKFYIFILRLVALAMFTVFIYLAAG